MEMLDEVPGELEISIIGSCLKLRGDIDISNCEQLRKRMQLLFEAGHPRMQIDLENVRYIDSVGVAAILKARAHLKQHSRDLQLTGASVQVRRVFRLLGLEPLLS